MSSLQGFRCRRCRAEILARPPERRRDPDAGDGVPPILCCGLPPRRLPPEQVLSARLPRPRQARCAVCGYSVQVVVRPDGPLVCATCRRELEVPAEEVPRSAREGPPVARPTGGVG